jgi:long-chain acyl-CoA synthetase
MKNYPWYPIVPITDLKDMLTKSVTAFGEKDAFLVKEGKAIRGLTYQDFGREVYALGSALFDLGFGPGKRLGVCSEGRWEWAAAYLSVACGNGINVPLDKDLRPQEIRHILEDSETEYVIASARCLGTILEVRSKLPLLKTIICMDREGSTHQGVLFLGDLLEKGRKLLAESRDDFAMQDIDPEQPVSLAYTSGTMGSAKGVVLSQRNIAANMTDMCKSVYIGDEDTFLSVLPLHHTYECTCGMLTPLYRGCTLAYCDNLRYLADYMKEFRPTIMLGVPLLFQSIHRKIQDGIRQKGQGKFLVAKTVANVTQRLLGRDIRKKIFGKVHETFGGRLRLLISGGAAVDPQVSRFFRELGVHMIQGYGLTECAPLLAVNRPDYFKDASAGLPAPSVEIRIAEDGEILARGPNIMLRYHRNPEATAAVLRDGWFHTGDLGYLDEDGFVFIHGRKKAVIVLSNGKNVYAEEVEFILNQSPFILESLVWEGPDQASSSAEEIHAILVPDQERFDQYAKEKGVTLTDEIVREVLAAEVRREGQRLPYYKRVRKFTTRWEEFDKTTTRKIKRYLYTEKPKNLPAV